MNKRKIILFIGILGFTCFACFSLWYTSTPEFKTTSTTQASIRETGTSESVTGEAIALKTEESITATELALKDITATAEAVATVQATEAARPTHTPTRTPTFTPEPTPAPVGNLVLSSGANLRGGPGTEYPVVGSAAAGDILPVFAMTNNGWLQVDETRHVWIASSLGTIDTPVAEIPIVDSTSLLAADEQQSGFSTLQIDDVTYNGEVVIISGSTDLPDGALLDITFDITGYDPDDLYLGVSKQVEVLNGHFSASIKPPNLPEYEKGPYEVEVRFRPNSPFGSVQSDTVLALVGEEGENLIGDNVERLPIGMNGLVVSEILNLPLEIQIPTYPQIDASFYPSDTPERALAEYLLAWQAQDWQRMAEFTQLTWREDGTDDPAEDLMFIYDFKTLLGAEIGDKEIIAVITEEDVWVNIEVVLYYSIQPTKVEKRIIRPMIVRETAPYTPSRFGDWGVNPTSTFAEEEVN